MHCMNFDQNIVGMFVGVSLGVLNRINLVPLQITNRSTTAEATILITVKFYFAITMTTFIIRLAIFH
jgi:hypothetical protein